MTGHFVRKEVLDHILSLRFTILAALGTHAADVVRFMREKPGDPEDSRVRMWRSLDTT